MQQKIDAFKEKDYIDLDLLKDIDVANSKKIEYPYKDMAQTLVANLPVKIIALVPNKKNPLEKEWQKKATNDSKEINYCAERYPDANIGIKTGADVDLIGLDVDLKNGNDGYETLQSLVEIHGALPMTYTVKTRSGGCHFYFELEKGTVVRNRVAIAQGLDIRGNNGMLVAPYSVVDGNSYVPITDYIPFAKAPDWLIDLVNEKPKTKETNGIVYEGGRHDRLFGIAIDGIREGKSIEEMLKQLLYINQQLFDPPLPENEIETLVEGAYEKYAEQINYNHTDLGNSLRMIDISGNNLRYVAQSKKWIQLGDNGIWAYILDEHMGSLAIKVAKHIQKEAKTQLNDNMRKATLAHARYSESKSGLNNMTETCKKNDGITISAEDLNNCTTHFPVQNGAVDLSTGELQPYKPEWLVTEYSNVTYDVLATAPLWNKFLNDIFGGDHELIKYIQRIVGYSLMSHTNEQKLFFLYGYGANGKSTFMNILGRLFGGLAKSASSEILLGKDARGGPTPEWARLVSARLVAMGELPDGRAFDDATIKSVTGGDTIVVRELYCAPFEFKPKFKIWMAGNHKPIVRGTDEGIWRRLVLIPFLITIPVENRDRHLEAKLTAELSGILNWAIEGALSYNEMGLGSAVAIEQSHAEYRSDMDITGQWIDEFCELDNGLDSFELPFNEAYLHYKQWAEENYGRARSSNHFGRTLTERGFEKVGTRKRSYRGLRMLKTLSIFNRD